ncbi:HD domain-containing protein [Actinomadura rayongensis]|uniref:HD domain-containing protein n=1 Tax=Actinomadura rayongensis TaxID=1429076 RepID=A0A6I4W0G3_9ACTN|nr:HD domain-containing protein [Actinomadura rayongensis]MXQ63003.1 HD domain-containing protein [Actinomadura rayongensis]
MNDDGALNLAASARFSAGTLRVQAGDLLTRFRRPPRADLAAPAEPPDSRLARDILALATEAYSPALLGHCQRCWYWADTFARIDGVRYDPELLYAACLLHDIALGGPDVPASCFAVHGAHLAQQRLHDWGLPDDFAATVAEAITLHMNPRVSLREGPEAHLLHAAAHLDVAGTRAVQIPRTRLREVIARHPRDGFADDFGRRFRHEAAVRPRSRAAVAWRLGMRVPLRLNPLNRRTGPADQIIPWLEKLR